MNYNSQYHQDKYLNENVFFNKKNGFFVDIGGSEPINQNNTYFFEQNGWNGILIEPRFKEYENIKKHRKCYVENIAIYDKCGTYDFLECDGYIKGLSGLLCEQKPQHLNRIFNDLLTYGKSVEISKIQTMSMVELIKKYSINYIDYLSLDTEGAELAILKTIDFNKIKIKAISVENNYGENLIYNLLTTNGFEKITDLGCDEIYINKTI